MHFPKIYDIIKSKKWEMVWYAQWFYCQYYRFLFIHLSRRYIQKDFLFEKKEQ